MYKRIFEFELQLSSYWQNIKFSWYWPKFHIFANIVIFQVYLQLFRPTASSLLMVWQWHVRNTLFHFCQLWAVKAYYKILRESRAKISKRSRFYTFLYNCRVQIKAYFSSSKWNRLIPLLDPTPKIKFRFTWNSRGKICSCVARHAPLPCWQHNTSYINHKHLSTW